MLINVERDSQPARNHSIRVLGTASTEIESSAEGIPATTTVGFVREPDKADRLRPLSHPLDSPRNTNDRMFFFTQYEIESICPNMVSA